MKYGKDVFSKFHGYAYDGVWTIALLLDRINRRLKEEGRNLTVANFQYKSDFWGRVFLNALNQTRFHGVTVNPH